MNLVTNRSNFVSPFGVKTEACSVTQKVHKHGLTCYARLLISIYPGCDAVTLRRVFWCVTFWVVYSLGNNAMKLPPCMCMYPYAPNKNQSSSALWKSSAAQWCCGTNLAWCSESRIIRTGQFRNLAQFKQNSKINFFSMKIQPCWV